AAIVSSWGVKDEPGASAWVGAMAPGRERDQSAEALAYALSERNPQRAWDWALRIGDPGEREKAATHVANMMASRDFALAQQWIDTSPFQANTKAQLQAGLLSARRKGIGP